MNDAVKIGDYVYLRKGRLDFDLSKKYKVACIRTDDIIIEYPKGWSPSMDDIAFLGLIPGNKYWYTSKYLVCKQELIINNE